MSKSLFPGKIDSSKELPIVRNNITEINADVINSLRDAIIQIEKTLGINPQGSSTVSERISGIMDVYGSLKKEALDKAGIIYGPITNDNISKVAAIDEAKLKLDFPTKVLQTEYSLVKEKIDNFIETLTDISAKLSSHLNANSSSRHNSRNIYVLANTAAESTTALQSFIGGSLEEFINDFFNSHVNFSGSTSQDNRVHDALQIYYDNSKTSSSITSVNVQGAIDDLASKESILLKTNLLATNSNGIPRHFKAIDILNNLNGKLILESSVVSYSANNTSLQVITLSTPQALLYDIEKFDIAILSNSFDITDDREYLILDYSLDGSGSLETITILGGTKNNSIETSSLKVVKNPYQYSNINAYNTTVRPRYSRTNTPDIIVAHPNSATVISSGICPEKINSSVKLLNFEIDGSTYSIDVYDVLKPAQTIDTIVWSLNTYFSDNRIPAFAYKQRVSSCYEIAISHLIPTWIDSTLNRYIKIKESNTNDASTQLGFSNFVDKEVYGSYGNSILINGITISDPGFVSSYTSSDVELVVGTNNVLFNTINPLQAGIKVGNLCHIDNIGTYRVSEVYSGYIVLDDQDYLFTGNIATGDKLFIYGGTVSLEALEFSEIVGPDGSILVDIFMTEQSKFGYSIRASIEGSLHSSSFYGAITDISKNYSIGLSDILTISSAGIATVDNGTDVSSGDKIYSSGEYAVRSPDGASFYKVNVTGGFPSSDTSVTITGVSELAYGNFLLSRILYSTSLGFILGDSNIGVPSVLDKRITGTTNEIIISPSLIEKYVEGPRSELRGDGVVNGLSVTIADVTTTECTISISAGFAYVSGIRYKFDGVEELPFVHDGLNFYIAIDKNGCLRVSQEVQEPSTLNYVSPFYGLKVAYISYAKYIASSFDIIDLRKTIANLDKKINEIIVAEEESAGHFTSIKKAVDYARVYKKIWESNSIPSILIKNGTYTIDETIWLDFDISISGSGPGTIITKSSEMLDNSNSPTSSFSEGDYQNAAFAIGSPSNTNYYQSEDIIYGVSISNLTCLTPQSISSLSNSYFNFFFLILQYANDSEFASYKFNNINFIGDITMQGSTTNDPALLDGARQEIPIAFGGAHTPPYTPQFGSLIVNSCFFSYSGTEWAALGCLISYSGSYSIRNIIVSSNIFKKCSTNVGNVTLGNYEIFGISDNYTLTNPSTAITIFEYEISIVGNTTAD